MRSRSPGDTYRRERSLRTDRCEAFRMLRRSIIHGGKRLLTRRRPTHPVKHSLRPRSDSLCTGSTRLVVPPGDAGFTGDLSVGFTGSVNGYLRRIPATVSKCFVSVSSDYLWNQTRRDGGFFSDFLGRDSKAVSNKPSMPSAIRFLSLDSVRRSSHPFIVCWTNERLNRVRLAHAKRQV
jgi:hypothetical protein